MRIIITKDYEEMCHRAVALVANEIRQKPRLVLGLDVSNTLIGIYKELIQYEKDNKVDFSRVATFNLDEYMGLGGDHEQSCRYFMDTNFFNHINIDRRNIYIPNGLTKDPESTCRQYELAIRELAGIDVQLMAIGSYGHIGFNEPGSSLRSRTRIKTLRPEVVKEKEPLFKGANKVPRFALTMGVGTILEARRCVLLASGKRKAEAVVRALEGPVSTTCPASMLQLHYNSVVILDEEAAANLADKDYYKYVEGMSEHVGDAQI
jgi:glucosamine-6-phosphate deaminase